MTRELFADRSDAGRRLAEVLAAKGLTNAVVVAIPRGGVPVGVEIARALRCPLKLIVLRKLFIPSSPEAGFGAMAPDGSVSVDESFVAQLGMSPADVAAVINQVQWELKRRHALYETVGEADVRGCAAILVDDGIAAGYSMAAAARYLRKFRPRTLCVAVPCAPTRSLDRIRHLTDEMICLEVSLLVPFAVASFYCEWHDLTDAEVQASLASLPLKKQ